MAVNSKRFKSITVFAADADRFTESVQAQKPKKSISKAFTELLDQVPEAKMPEPAAGMQWVQVSSEEAALIKVARDTDCVLKAIPSKMSALLDTVGEGEVVIPVKAPIAETLVQHCKVQNSSVSDLLAELLVALSPDSYLLVLEGKDNVDAVGDAMTVYLEKHKVDKVEESVFLKEVCDSYVSTSGK